MCSSALTPGTLFDQSAVALGLGLCFSVPHVRSLPVHLASKSWGEDAHRRHLHCAVEDAGMPPCRFMSINCT